MSHPESGQLTTGNSQLATKDVQQEWTIRPYREGDIPAMVAVWNAAFAADGLDDIKIGEAEQRAELGRPNFDPARQVIIVDGPAEGVPGGMIPGFGIVDIRDDKDASERIYNVLTIAYPSMREFGLERVIAGRLLEIAHKHEREPDTEPMQKVRVSAGFSDKQLSQKALYESLGMTELRQYWTMACPLEKLDEPQAIDGVTIRNYKYPEDNDPALEAFNNSFSDHFDFHPSDPERWDYRVKTPMERLDLSWLADEESNPGKIAGFCMCGIFAEENEATGRKEGWIELLGTTRDWRRMGLGRALLLHGLHSLRSVGLETGMLGVDATSLTGAQRLYESVGFRVRHVWLNYDGLLTDIKE